MFLKGQTQGARGEGWGHDVGWGARSHVGVVQPGGAGSLEKVILVSEQKMMCEDQGECRETP